MIDREKYGLEPYNPSHLTEEEWNRLVENGRKAWGKKPSEPVNGNLFGGVEEDEILICTLDGYQYFLGPEYDGELDWDDAKKWCESLGEDYELPNRLVMLAICMNEATTALLKEYSYYWTSSEAGDGTSGAWVQARLSSVPGLQCCASKAHAHRVRAVRRQRIEEDK